MTPNPPNPPPSPVIKSESVQPCGCRVTEFGDGTKQLAPCVPCGLFAVARAASNAGAQLQQAADALAATATTMRNQLNMIVTENAVKAASKLRPVT